MTMSACLSPSSVDETEISVGDREYFRAQTQREAYNLVLERFSELSGDHVALRALIAKRLGKNRAQVTRWLSEPSNMTLDTLSDLLLAMGSEARMRQCPFGSEPKGNYLHPASTNPAPHEQVMPSTQGKTSTTDIKAWPNLGQSTLRQQTSSGASIRPRLLA